MEPGEEGLPHARLCLRRLVPARRPVVRVAPPVEAIRKAQLKLSAPSMQQLNACRQPNLQAAVEHSGIEAFPASVERGLAGVRSIDEAAAFGADQAHSQAQIRNGPDGAGRGEERIPGTCPKPLQRNCGPPAPTRAPRQAGPRIETLRYEPDAWRPAPCQRLGNCRRDD